MKKSRLIMFLVILSMLLPSVVDAREHDIQRFFSVNLLSPNTDPILNQWSKIIEEQLPKIGIGVVFHESTSWENIALRTWSYPLIDYDYIPIYSEGGFDILFLTESWDIDWYPYKFYIPCFTSSFHQYINPYYDSVLSDYETSLDPLERTEYAQELQRILYEDLPAIQIFYPSQIFGFNKNVSGVNPTLLNFAYPRPEYWKESGDKHIIYALFKNLSDYNNFKIKFNDQFGFDTNWAQCVYGSLFKRNQDSFDWETSIAKNITISDVINRNFNITIDLDVNAKFSGGESVLSEDIKYSYNLFMTPAVNSPNYEFLCSWFKNNDSIVVVDEDTLRFEFDKFYNFIYSILSFGIIDKSVVEPLVTLHGYEIFNQEPFSTNVSDALVTSCGPFKLSKYDVNNGVVELIPNEFWSGHSLSLENITFVSIQDKEIALSELASGSIDIVDADYDYNYSHFENLNAINAVYSKSLTAGELAFNMKHPIMGTGELTLEGTAEYAKKIRQAINYAIPRQIIIDEILDGMATPGVTFCPEGCIGYDDSLMPYEYNLDKAIELIGVMYWWNTPTTLINKIEGITIIFSMMSIGFISIFLNYWKRKTIPSRKSY